MKLEVEIKGVRPLLTHAPKGLMQKAKLRRKTDEYDPREDAENAAYRDSENNLVVPADNIFACLVQAAKQVPTKRGQISMTNRVKGSVTVEPEFPRLLDEFGKPYEAYEIHSVPGVIQRQRIVVSRPIYQKWGLKFSVVWNPAIYGLAPAVMRSALEEMGRVGLCDWRPRFGTFTVKSVEETE